LDIKLQVFVNCETKTIVQLAVLQNSSAAGATQTNFVKLPKRYPQL